MKNILDRAEHRSGSEASAAGAPSLKEILHAIQTEIGAGEVMFPKSDSERAHNNACERAIAIIKNYRDGFGLFQIVQRIKSAAPSTSSTTAVEDKAK